MSDIPARIKDLTERIAIIKDEIREVEEWKFGAAENLYGDKEGRTKRLRELEDELKEIQPPTDPTSVNTSMEYPEFSIADPNPPGLGLGVHEFDTWPTTEPVDGDYLGGSAKELGGERYGTTEVKPSDPMNDPEIKAIEKRYRETIGKLDEENAKFNNTKKVVAVVSLVVVAGIAYLALRSNDDSVTTDTVADSVAVPVNVPPVPPVTVVEVALPQATTAAAAGYSCVGDQFQLFDNSNGSLVSGGGGTPPSFTTGGKPYCLANMSTYHWNDGKGAPPGKVGLRGTQEMVGPAQAQGTSGQGGAQNVNWVYVPASDAIPLLNGQYSCTDSDPATWSQNNESGGQGFCRVWVQTAEK